MPGYVEDELRGYLAGGLLCFGFAQPVCMTCRTGFVVAFSCKGRGVEQARKPAVQALGDGDHPLPHGHRWNHVIGEVGGGL